MIKSRKKAKKAVKKIQPALTPLEISYGPFNRIIISAPVQTPASFSTVNDIFKKIKLGNYNELKLQKLFKAASNVFAKKYYLENNQ